MTEETPELSLRTYIHPLATSVYDICLKEHDRTVSLPRPSEEICQVLLPFTGTIYTQFLLHSVSNYGASLHQHLFTKRTYVQPTNPIMTSSILFKFCWAGLCVCGGGGTTCPHKNKLSLIWKVLQMNIICGSNTHDKVRPIP